MARAESTQPPRDAVMLLSGGLDSAVTAAIAREDGYELYAITFAYGQRHCIETEAARRVAHAMGVRRHVFQTIDLSASAGFGGSALTDDIDVPRSDRDRAETEIPVTYVPARNTIFLAFALAYAETIGTGDIFIGVNAVDYSGYPDCRPAFIRKFEELAQLATKAGTQGQRFTIHTPLITISKADIVREGARLGVDFALTHSCYDPAPDGRACGACDSCTLRRRGFEEARVPDPTQYTGTK